MSEHPPRKTFSSKKIQIFKKIFLLRKRIIGDIIEGKKGNFFLKKGLKLPIALQSFLEIKRKYFPFIYSPFSI